MVFVACCCNNSSTSCIFIARGQRSGTKFNFVIQEKQEDNTKSQWHKTESKSCSNSKFTFNDRRGKHFPCRKVRFLGLPTVYTCFTFDNRYHPLDHRVLYTIVNTSPPRSRKSKTTSRQAFVLKWNTDTWTVEKMRKIGDRGVTCFDIR